MQKFNTSLNGYNKLEVNSFVNQVTSEYEEMLNKLKKQDQDIALLKNELARYKQLENTLNRALMIAEDTSTQIRKVAKDEAKNVVDDARRNASRIVNEALIKAQNIESEAEELKRRVGSFKRRFKVVIQEELAYIEKIEEDY